MPMSTNRGDTIGANNGVEEKQTDVRRESPMDYAHNFTRMPSTTRTRISTSRMGGTIKDSPFPSARRSESV